MTFALPTLLSTRRLAALLGLAASLTAGAPRAWAGLLDVTGAARNPAVTTAAGRHGDVDLSRTGTVVQSVTSPDGAPAASASQVSTIGADSFTAQARASLNLGLNEAGSAVVHDLVDFDVGSAGLNYQVDLSGTVSALADNQVGQVNLQLRDALTSVVILQFSTALDALSAPLSFSGTLDAGHYRFTAALFIDRSVDGASRSFQPVSIDASMDLSLALSAVGAPDDPHGVPEPASALLALLALGLGRAARGAAPLKAG